MSMESGEVILKVSAKSSHVFSQSCWSTCQSHNQAMQAYKHAERTGQEPKAYHPALLASV